LRPIGHNRGVRNHQRIDRTAIEPQPAIWTVTGLLSPQLLRILRTYYRLAQPGRWLFPGHDPAEPVSAATLQHDAAVLAALALLDADQHSAAIDGSCRNGSSLQARWSPIGSQP
jgi:hypothetical protein